MAWSIFRYRLLNIVPLAHDAVVRSLRDPVIVLDARQHVADINPSAARLLGRTVDEVVGEVGKTALAAWPDVVAQFTGANDGETEVSLCSNGLSRPYTLRLSTLLDRGGHPSGRLLHLQDIEKHKQTEAALHETEESFYNEVLGVAKIDSGQVEWQRQPVVVAQVIERAVAATAAACEHKGLQIRTDIEPALPDLVGDQERLIQAPSREEALATELQIKGWSRKKKQALVRGDWPEISRLARRRRPFGAP